MLTASVLAPAIVPLLMWLGVILLANLTWMKARRTSRTLTLAAVITPLVWVLPILVACFALAVWAIALPLRAALHKRQSGQVLATGFTSV
jgi:hypothetical protein